jgi:hypothetical protein
MRRPSTPKVLEFGLKAILMIFQYFVMMPIGFEI